MNRIKTLLSFLILGTASHVLAVTDFGDLDPKRFPQPWSEVKASFSGTWDTVDVSKHGITPNTGTGVASVFQKMLNEHSGRTVFYFPEGAYTFESNIRILLDRIRNDHVILKGAGPEKTKFLFTGDLEYFTGLIVVEDKASFGDRNNAISLASAPKAGDNTLQLTSPLKAIVPGRILCVKQDNDRALMFPDKDADRAWYQKWKNGEADWSDESMGQFVRVQSVNGNTVVLEDRLGLDFTAEHNPRISIYDSFGEEVGVEDLYIEHTIPQSRYKPDGTNDVFNFVFRFVAKAYVRNVHSVNAARGHVLAEYTYDVAVVDSYFERARNYGVGGAGYGVAVQNRSAKTYISNNVFDHLRHAVVLKEGANHTVVSYNVSKNWAILDPAVVDDQGNRIEAEADMSVHGFYSHNNLFEGNLCHNIFLADYWGPTGPGTVAFRNKTYGTDNLSGIWVDDFSHHESVIANELPGQSQLVVTGGSEDVWLEGNVVGSSVIWTNLAATTRLPASLYLNEKPEFWDATLLWPPFGPDVVNAGSRWLPAQESSFSTSMQTIRSIPRTKIQDSSQFNLLGQSLKRGAK